MKKRTVLGLGLSLLLAAPGMPSAVLADELNDDPIEEVDNTDEGDTEEEVELEIIKELTLEKALEKALSNESSLMLLNYQLEIMENQEQNTNKSYRDTAFDIRDLERTRDRLRNLSNTFQERYQIQQQLEALEDVMEQLEKALEQIKSGKVTLTYTNEEAVEGIKMATIATYSQLLMEEEQLDFQKKALKVKQKEVDMMKRQYEIGTLSYQDYMTEAREIAVQKANISQAEKEWDKTLADFALDLGILYQPDMKIQSLDLSEQTLIEQEKSTDELIKNLYEYKSQEEAIALAKFQRDKVYEDDDSNTFDKNEADLDVKVEEEKLVQLKLEKELAIRQLYYDVEDGYQAIMDAERDYQFAQEDLQVMKRRYELGIIPKINYELSAIQVDQAKLKYDLSKMAYHLTTQQVELLEAGVIR